MNNIYGDDETQCRTVAKFVFFQQWRHVTLWPTLCLTREVASRSCAGHCLVFELGHKETRLLRELRCMIATQKKEDGLSQLEGRRAVRPKHRCGRPDAWRRRNEGQSQCPVKSQHPGQ